MRKAIEKFLFDIFSAALVIAGVVALIMVASYAWHFGQITLYNDRGYPVVPVVVNNNFNMQDGITAKTEE